MSRLPVSLELSRPSKPVGWTAAVLVVSIWGVLRLVVFQSIVFPLTYVLPLLLCVWTRDRAMLWTMAGVFAVFHTIKQFVVLPADALPTWADWTTYAVTLFNISVGAVAVHGIIVLRERLEASLERVQAQSEELVAQNDELAQQSEELTQQSEELATQNEELTQQSDELSGQAETLSVHNEELQAQGEEIQSLNVELGQREALLQHFLDLLGSAGTAASAVERVCRVATEMLTPHVSAAAIYEADGDGFALSGSAPAEGAGWRDAGAEDAGFFALAIEQNRTVGVDDLRLRPDLRLPVAIEAQQPAGVLATPLRADGRAFGLLVVCASTPHAWTSADFRVVEWLAAQAGHILSTIRLRDQLARQAALIDLTPDAVIVRQVEGTVTLWGHGAEVLYGWTKEEAVGAPIHALLRTRFPEPIDAILSQVERTGRWSGELVHTTKDGRELVVQSRWLARRDDAGALTELLESNVDITGRKRTEEALRDADRRKSQFLATLSHELRNPLAPIRYALQMLDGNGRENLEAKRVIDRQIAHLVHLVDELLDLTRIASNKIRLRTARVEVAAVVEQAVEACRPEIEQAGHTLTVTPPPAPLWVNGDADRLAQVLTNLLTNAARYTPAGGKIGVEYRADEGNVELRVWDTGVGLRQEDLSRVFDMFEQVGEPGHGGLGIGLSLVKELVTLHGGSVCARSAGLGCGAEFVVRLPSAAALAPADASASTAPSARTVPARRILVVDDNADAAQMLKMLLELDGHRVEAAYDAETALARLSEQAFDVGLFDIGLPGINGYELAGHARRVSGNRALYLVALTGWGQDADRERARQSGFDAHLTKPALPETLRAVISQAADAPSAFSS